MANSRASRTSPAAPRPFVEISGSISSSSRCFLSRKLCPILCVTSRVHSTVINWTPDSLLNFRTDDMGLASSIRGPVLYRASGHLGIQMEACGVKGESATFGL